MSLSVVSEMWMLVLACTLPLPAGYFMPVFIYGECFNFKFPYNKSVSLHPPSAGVKAVFFLTWQKLLSKKPFLIGRFGFSFPGAAIGRLIGEGAAYLSSTGVTPGQQWGSVNPGGYALAGRKT